MSQNNKSHHSNTHSHENEKRNVKPKRKRKKIWLIPVLAIVVFFLVDVILLISNKFSLTLDYPEESATTIPYNTTYEKPTITAKYVGSILHFWDCEPEVTVHDNIDYQKLGTYDVVLLAEHGGLMAQSIIHVTIEDQVAPEITLVSKDGYYTKPNEEYVEEGFQAIDDYDGDLTDQVEIVQKEGYIFYYVKDSSGNETTIQRRIPYDDRTAPVITLYGDTTLEVSLGTEFVDPGYTAIDDCDGEITGRVTIKGDVDTSTAGTYTRTYEVKDSYQNVATATRTVIVKDFTAPGITMNGDAKMYVVLGEYFADPGATAYDSVDGDLTSRITIEGSVDTSKEGAYELRYSVSDNAGNYASVTRMVYVFQKQQEEETVNPGSKVVYLTFDDGPSSYTEKLLNILDKYGVKATFFVTGQSGEHKSYVKEIYARGHSIGLHTWSHNYSTVYASETAYFEDLNRISDYVYEQTGFRSHLIRFPGGSSNTISRSFCSGIMSALVNSVGTMGYRYCDWNVDSRDGEGITDSNELAQNVINGIKKCEVSVSLQHDTVRGSVEAVEQILAWGISNGYTFLPITDSTPMVHHGVFN